MDEMLMKARKEYFASAAKLAQASDCAIVVGETTIMATDEIREAITRNLQDKYRDACKEYYDALCKARDAVWDEYMKTFGS